MQVKLFYYLAWQKEEEVSEILPLRIMPETMKHEIKMWDCIL